MTLTPLTVRRAQSVFDCHVLAELREISLAESEFSLTLTGRVGSYYLKLMAQEAIKPLAGDREILNHIEVEDRRVA